MGEYLPFWWNLELGDNVDMDAMSCSDISDGKQIPAESLKCTFELYNGSSNEPVMTIPNVDCFEDKWESDSVFMFDDFPWMNQEKPMGRSYMRMTEGRLWWVLGEYQLVLAQVAYTKCDTTTWWASRELFQWVSDSRICAMNFAVSDSYLINQWWSLSTAANTDLSKFRSLNNISILPPNELALVTETKTSSYDATQLNTMLASFVEQYQYLAVGATNEMTKFTNQAFRRVVNQDVFLYDGWQSRVPLVIRGWSLADTIGKTVIVKNADLIVEWSVYGNVLWLVADGVVEFRNINCDISDTVQWFYVTHEWFRSRAIIEDQEETKIRNDNLWAMEWCEDWRLVIDWFLLWPGVWEDSFVDARRSNMEQWFNITSSTQVDKVYEGASVLMKQNSAGWSRLPLGATKFQEISTQIFK